MSRTEDGIEDISRAYELYIVTSVFLAATVITTAARIGTKLAFGVRLGTDDRLIILGSALNVVADACDYKATASGFGRHAVFLSEDQLIQAAKYSQLAVGIAIWAIGIIKLSVCFFLLNLIRGTHKRFRWAIYGMIVLNVGFTLVGAILWGTQARPLARLWDPRIHGTSNSAQEFLVMVYIVYAYGCFTDILYALSPVYFLWSVQLKWDKKLPIMLITGCAILVVVVAVLNIIFAREFLNQKDSTWALINEFICDIVERNFSAFVSNLPALWMLRSRLRERCTIYQSKESYSTRAGYLPTSLAMGNVEQRSIITSESNKAHVRSHALAGHLEMIEFGDKSHLLHGLPAGAHGINIQTDVEVQNEPKHVSAPLNGRFDV